jgi:hypothetical protein
MVVAATWDAPLVVVGVAALGELEAAVDPAAAEEPAAVPLERDLSAPGVGEPKSVTPDGTGPTGAEAEAPIPTKNPAFCPGVPEEASAAAWKAVKVFPVTGALMAPTIPARQWGDGLSCWQKNQRGLESSVIVRFHSGVSETAVRIWTQPESNPPSSGWQGSLKVDCVTEWFPGTPVNWKLITVPFVALTLGGMNWKTPPAVDAVAPTFITTGA